MSFEDMPVEVGVIYEGERVRKAQMHVEFGGPKITEKFELCRVKKMDEVEDMKVIIEGPDISELEEEKSYPLGIIVEVAGKEVEEELEGVFERRLHEFNNYIQGWMHLNQRYDIWMRLSKDSFKKGLNTFKVVGTILMRLYKAELPIIEKIQIRFVTDSEKIKTLYEEALQIYEARDARARALSDDDVEEFYGCVLCQSFAPSHCCVITPQRMALCGAISWFDARASARIDPKGPNFKIDKGECVELIKGEYTGANKAVKEKSLGEVERVYLHTIFEYPHTSCGCFEAIAFYIPEVDGIALAHRDFRGPTVNGLAFSTMATSVGGGLQTEGFLGISIEYMRSPKFLQADGGWTRIVWAPADIKERVKDGIPEELFDKVATENDAMTVEDLKAFLKEKQHPVVERWAEEDIEGAIEAAPEVPTEAAAPTPQMQYQMPQPMQVPQMNMPLTAMPGMGGIQLQGFISLPGLVPPGAGDDKITLVLKGVKIFAEKAYIKREKKKR